MKIFLTISFLFVVVLTSNSQVAIIQDKDGYTNVRKEGNSKSEIIYQIKENEVFWVVSNDKKKDLGDWVSVYIPNNKFSIGCSSENSFAGYIQKSRFKLLEELVKYHNSDFVFKYSLKAFNKKSHYIKYNDGKFIREIDGRHPWGTDGNFPKIEVENIAIFIKGTIIEINEVLYGDIYECDNHFDIYKNGDTYFAYQWNSDGAGTYEIVWVLTEKGLKQRLVGTID